MSRLHRGWLPALFCVLLFGCPDTTQELEFDGSSGDTQPWILPDSRGPDGLEAGSQKDVAVGNDAADAGVPNDGPKPDACGTPSSCGVVFKYPKGSESSVDLRGDFNTWGKTAMTASGSWWKATVTLKHGAKAKYKFFIDGTKWVKDPNNPADDGAPDYNSVLTVACPASCTDGGTITPDQGTTTPDQGSTPGAFDWRDAVMYFVLLDRFNNGDTSNDKKENGVETPANWQGGDLAGLLAKLKSNYFSNLGVNAIWISSPVDAPDGKYAGVDKHDYTGYHGYWPTKLTKVEERLGTLTLLKQVVAEAHKQGIKVVMDYVMNHVHKNSPTYASNKSWFWDLNYSGKTCVCGIGCSWDTSPDNLRCWFMPYLPDFNFKNAAARKFSIDNAIKWIKDTGVDGYRLDAVKHIEMSWLTDLRTQVNALGLKNKFYMVGETFTYQKNVLKPYIDPKTKLDGQFDFPLREKLVNIILRRQSNFYDLDTFLNANDGYYGSGAIMGNFIGNHDLPRSIHLAEDSPVFGSMDGGKSKSWYTNLKEPNYAKPYERLGVAFTALMTLQGVPLIYYGDEIGLAGGGDPDNRRFMKWSGLSSHQTKLKAHVAKLGKIRAANSALRRGVRKERWKENDVYAYSMTHGSNVVYVVLNRSDSSKTIKLPGTSLTDQLTGSKVTASSVTVGARSSMVLK